MKLAALCSGGKDSSYALWLASEEGHEIVELVAMIPEREDSWMFHKPNPQLIDLFAEAARLPLRRGETIGTKGQEIEDLKSSLEELSIDGVVSGAVASTYQKDRIERVCEKLDIASLTPLWKEEPLSLLRDMLEDKLKIIITSVSAEGFGREWLGRKIDEKCLDDLKELRGEYGIHIAGEGGEYETLVLDAPFFKERIVPVKTERIWEGDRGCLKIEEAELAQK